MVCSSYNGVGLVMELVILKNDVFLQTIGRISRLQIAKARSRILSGNAFEDKKITLEKRRTFYE